MTQDRQHNLNPREYTLIEVAFGNVDAILDRSEDHDYEYKIIESVFENVDITLDFSEFFDYKLGGYSIDYIIPDL